MNKRKITLMHAMGDACPSLHWKETSRKNGRKRVSVFALATVRGATNAATVPEGRATADTREANGHRCAFTRGAADGNRPSMLLNNFLHGRKTEA
jgi:hypothetical protein